jgi:hypothetical protein
MAHESLESFEVAQEQFRGIEDGLKDRKLTVSQLDNAWPIRSSTKPRHDRTRSTRARHRPHAGARAHAHAGERPRVRRQRMRMRGEGGWHGRCFQQF